MCSSCRIFVSCFASSISWSYFALRYSDICICQFYCSFLFCLHHWSFIAFRHHWASSSIGRKCRIFRSYDFCNMRPIFTLDSLPYWRWGRHEPGCFFSDLECCKSGIRVSVLVFICKFSYQPPGIKKYIFVGPHFEQPSRRNSCKY